MRNKSEKQRVFIYKWSICTYACWSIVVAMVLITFAVFISDAPLYGEILTVVILVLSFCAAVVINSMRVEIDHDGIALRFMGRVKARYSYNDIMEIKPEWVYSRFRTHYKFYFKTKDSKFTIESTKKLVKLLEEYANTDEAFSIILGECRRQLFLY